MIYNHSQIPYKFINKNMLLLLQILKRYFIPHRTTKISQDPNGEGIRVGKENRLIPWSNMKEFREDVYVGRRPTIWGNYYTVITSNDEEIPINILGETLKRMIIDESNLKNQRTDFWLSQKVYSRK